MSHRKVLNKRSFLPPVWGRLGSFCNPIHFLLIGRTIHEVLRFNCACRFDFSSDVDISSRRLRFFYVSAPLLRVCGIPHCTWLSFQEKYESKPIVGRPTNKVDNLNSVQARLINTRLPIKCDRVVQKKSCFFLSKEMSCCFPRQYIAELWCVPGHTRNQEKI